jgi:hypothetical protein
MSENARDRHFETSNFYKQDTASTDHCKGNLSIFASSLPTKSITQG